jgi:hypothetical protein
VHSWHRQLPAVAAIGAAGFSLAEYPSLISPDAHAADIRIERVQPLIDSEPCFRAAVAPPLIPAGFEFHLPRERSPHVQMANAELPQITANFPTPTAVQTYPDEVFGKFVGLSIRDFDRAIARALCVAGFRTLGRFSTPDGYFLVTQPERYDVHGAPPGTHRFQCDPNSKPDFPFEWFLHLFDDVMRCRVFLFNLTTAISSNSSRFMIAETPDQWFLLGANDLDSATKELRITKRHRLKVGVFEIRARPGEPFVIVRPQAGIQVTPIDQLLLDGFKL